MSVQVLGATLTEAQVKRRTLYAHDHARDCRKPLSACEVCAKNMAWFGALPLHILSDVLNED